MPRSAGVLLSVASLLPILLGASSVPLGPSISVQEPAPISAVRLDADGDRVPDRLGDTVTVTGRATVELSVLDAQRMRLFVQDTSAGIMLFSLERTGSVEPGDRVVATGVVEHFRGLTEIHVEDVRVVPGTRRVPEPVELPADRAAFESLEGTLVRARAFVKGSGSNDGGRFLRLGPADAAEASFTVFVAHSHRDPPDLERFSVGDELEVTGLLGQHDAEPPYASSYELYPRSPGDLDAIGVPKVILQQVLLWTFALLALAALGLLVLRRQVRSRTRELAESEQAERESRERLSVLLGHAPVALWTTNRDLRIVWAEGRGLLDLGIEHDEVVGKPLEDVLGTDDPAFPPLDAYRRALDGTPGRFDIEWGDRFWEVRLHPLRQDGEIVGVVGAALDVTRYHEIERRLEEQSAYFQKLFDEAPEAIVLVDEDDRVLQVNPEFEEVFGYASDEAVGRLVNELIVVPGREAEATELTNRVAKGERLQVEAVRRHRDGTPIDVSILATPLEVGGRRRVYGIYRDVSEQKALEAQMLHSQRLEAVGQLAGGLAHDFNNILTAILGHTRVILEDLTDHDGLRGDLEQIEAAGERAARLTRQLLTFSRRDMISPRTVDLNAVIRETRALLGRLIEERVELAVELAEELPPVKADPAQLEQIVMNLVINARDAMPEGGEVRLTTRGLDGEGAGWVVLEVRDAGRGMTADEEARMFEPFFTTKRPGEGTGLGLSSVYGIVEHAGGFIEVDTSPGAGTAVTIHLPAARPTESPPAGPESPRPLRESVHVPGEPPPGADQLILLVDDDRPVRDVARRILERAGYRVAAVGSGQAALEYCAGSDLVPDGVVTDVVMPGMTGYELADDLRERYPGIPVLLMTGYTEAPAGDRDGPAGILRKPFDATTLVRRVREALSAS